MPVVVVAAGIAAYQYYEYKRQTPRVNLAGGGGGDDDGEKDATKTASADDGSKVEARDDDHGAEKEPETTNGHSDDDKTEESSSASFDEEDSGNGDSSSDCAADGGGAITQAKTPTLLQQWNEKYPHLVTQQQNGKHRNRWGAVLKKRFDEWRSAPSPSSSAAAAAASVGSGLEGAAYSEVWVALALRDDSSQEKEGEKEKEKETEEPPQQSRTQSPVAPPVSPSEVKPRTVQDTSLEMPRAAVARLEALRRNFSDWRNPQPPSEEGVEPRTTEAIDEAEGDRHQRDAIDGGQACYEEVWNLLFGCVSSPRQPHPASGCDSAWDQGCTGENTMLQSNKQETLHPKFGDAPQRSECANAKALQEQLLHHQDVF